MPDSPRDDEAALQAEEAEFSNDHPLSSPNELAGDAMSGLELEFAARDIAEAEAGGLPLDSDAQGAAAGMALDDGDEEEDTLPLEGY